MTEAQKQPAEEPAVAAHLPLQLRDLALQPLLLGVVGRGIELLLQSAELSFLVWARVDDAGHLTSIPRRYGMRPSPC